MRFADYQKTLTSHRDALSYATKTYALERVWRDAGPQNLPGIYETLVIVEPQGHDVVVRVSKHGDAVDPSRLSARERERVFAVYDVVDRWRSGTIEKLPETMPWETEVATREALTEAAAARAKAKADAEEKERAKAREAEEAKEAKEKAAHASHAKKHHK